MQTYTHDMFQENVKETRRRCKKKERVKDGDRLR
jgi:hypothetical protein